MGFEYNGKAVNNVTTEDAVRIKNRISDVMSKRVYYGPITMYRDMVAYAQAVGKRLDPYTEEEIPHEFNNQEGYAPPVPDNIRIKEEQGAKIINPLLGICDEGDFIFVVANDAIPTSFDRDQIDAFLTKLEKEQETEEAIYETEPSCRSACTGLCVGTCGNTCDGCSANCDNICTGCGSCTGDCSHLCGESCDSTCKNDCLGTCGGGCQGCQGDCVAGCFLVCYAACGGGCTAACSHTCKGGVGH